jgi:hypothetical protein
VFVTGCGCGPGFTGLIAAEVEFVAPSVLIGVGNEVKVADRALVYLSASLFESVGMKQSRTLC